MQQKQKGRVAAYLQRPFGVHVKTQIVIAPERKLLLISTNFCQYLVIRYIQGIDKVVLFFKNNTIS